jgi:hypothetical protein
VLKRRVREETEKRMILGIHFGDRKTRRSLLVSSPLFNLFFNRQSFFPVINSMKGSPKSLSLQIKMLSSDVIWNKLRVERVSRKRGMMVLLTLVGREREMFFLLNNFSTQVQKEAGQE